VITELHYKRNRPYLRALVFVLLVSWISLTISATCTMPSLLIPAIDYMPGCSQSGEPEHFHHQDHAPKSIQDCSFKPCLDSKPDSFTEFNRLTKPDIPVFILSLIWTFWCLFQTYSPIKVPRKTDPPLGRRVLLIYRFCTLLN
jgi:hypothetical protein